MRRTWCPRPVRWRANALPRKPDAPAIATVITAFSLLRELETSPEVPGRHRAVRRPRCADLEHALGQRTLAQPIGTLDRLLYPEIELGQHVRSAQPEHQEHLRRPATDALDAHERSNHLVVRELVQRLDRKLAARDARREILEVRQLLPRQSDGAQLLIGRPGELNRQR